MFHYQWSLMGMYIWTRTNLAIVFFFPLYNWVYSIQLGTMPGSISLHHCHHRDDQLSTVSMTRAHCYLQQLEVQYLQFCSSLETGQKLRRNDPSMRFCLWFIMFMVEHLTSTLHPITICHWPIDHIITAIIGWSYKTKYGKITIFAAEIGAGSGT